MLTVVVVAMSRCSGGTGEQAANVIQNKKSWSRSALTSDLTRIRGDRSDSEMLYRGCLADSPAEPPSRLKSHEGVTFASQARRAIDQEEPLAATNTDTTSF